MSAGNSHRVALLQKWESHLNPAQLDVWRTVLEMLPKDSPLVGDRGSWGLECALMAHIQRGATVAQILKARLIPQDYSQQVDRKQIASGNKEAA